MTAINDITGDAIQTKNNNDSYRNGWDRIFGNKTPEPKLVLKHNKGYIINVTTYENDGDNSKTCDLWTDDEKSMRAIVDICKLFSNCSYYNFVNLYEEEEGAIDEAYELIALIFDKYKILSISYGKKNITIANIDALLYDLSIMHRNEYWYIGYVQDYNVEYYKDDVYYEDIPV